MKKIKLPNSLLNIGKLSTGTLLGQIMTAITLPLFTRIYGPLVIGNWAYYSSIAMLSNSFSDLGLINLLMLNDNKEEQQLYVVIKRLVHMFSLILFLLFYLYNTYIVRKTIINSFLEALIVSILMLTLQRLQVANILLNKHKNYNLLMKTPLVTHVVSIFFAFILGITGYVEYGYYLSMILGNIVVLIYIGINSPNKSIIVSNKKMIEILKSNRIFGVKQLVSNIVIQLKSQSPTILIRNLFNATALGYYSLAYRLLNIPVTLVANSIGKVFYQKTSELKHDFNLIGNLTLKALNYGVKIAVIPIIIMMSFSDIVVPLVFGEDYIITGNIIVIMSIYALFMFLSMSINGVAIMINKQTYLIYSGIAQLISFSIGIYIGKAVFNSIYVSVLLLTVSYSVIQIIYFISVFKETNVVVREYLAPLAKNMLAIIVVVVSVRTIIHFLV